MSLGIVIPLIVLPIAIIGAFVWYRRSIVNMTATGTKPLSGVRLTAEALHRAPSPPWRAVYEIGGTLGNVDHVVVGPPGAIAITTLIADRPERAQVVGSRSEAQLVSDAAIARGPIDDLLRTIGESCTRSATVYWGRPSSQLAGEDLVHGSQLVEGQRLDEWLGALVDQTEVPLDQPRIDAVWRTIVTGIGRPDPLA